MIRVGLVSSSGSLTLFEGFLVSSAEVSYRRRGSQRRLRAFSYDPRNLVSLPGVLMSFEGFRVSCIQVVASIISRGSCFILCLSLFKQNPI